MRRLLAIAIKRAGSQKVLAARMGVSAQFLSDVRRGYRRPNDAILRELGLVERRIYVKG